MQARPEFSVHGYIFDLTGCGANSELVLLEEVAEALAVVEVNGGAPSREASDRASAVKLPVVMNRPLSGHHTWCRRAALGQTHLGQPPGAGVDADDVQPVQADEQITVRAIRSRGTLTGAPGARHRVVHGRGPCWSRLLGRS